MCPTLRKALISDKSTLETLIETSSRALQKDVYTETQIQAALGPIFGVDEQMIRDGTYFVVEAQDRIVGCGGWSFREAMFGGRSASTSEPRRLDPECEAARVRAFFVDPEFVRRGIGSLIMDNCEQEIQKRGFCRGEISATLVGEPLYRKFGYTTTNYYEIELIDQPGLRVARMIKKYTEENKSVVATADNVSSSLRSGS